MSDGEARDGRRMKIRQSAVALRSVALFLSLPVGSAEAAAHQGVGLEAWRDAQLVVTQPVSMAETNARQVSFS